MMELLLGPMIAAIAAAEVAKHNANKRDSGNVYDGEFTKVVEDTDETEVQDSTHSIGP